MELCQPSTLSDALAALADLPRAMPVAGGTDVMVALNFGRIRPLALVNIRRLDELKAMEVGPAIVCGAGCSYAFLLRCLGGVAPAMTQAIQTIGSPQIRNAGTVGGNLGTCSPAGDVLPVLSVLDADVVLASSSGTRRMPFAGWMLGPKQPAGRADELVVAVEWAREGGRQIFMKAGSRNAMVIAVANLAMVVAPRSRSVRIALGSVGPTVIRAEAAEAFACGLYEESGWEAPLRASMPAAGQFAELVANAARPLDDVRGSARYRRHVLTVMARRALERTGVPQ